MGISAPWKPVMLPVRLSPEALNVKVVSAIWPPRPGTWAVHFPLTSAAMATRLIAINKVADKNNFFIVMAKTLHRRALLQSWLSAYRSVRSRSAKRLRCQSAQMLLAMLSLLHG